MATDWAGLWHGMNDRQRHFLTTLYWTESGRAAYYNSQRAMFDPLKKGAAWRWMVHNPPGQTGGLRDKLGEEAEYDRQTGKRREKDEKLLNNQGSGSTYKVLEELGYLERKWESTEVFSMVYGSKWIDVLWVRLTPRGRKLAKMFLVEQTEERAARMGEGQEKVDEADPAPDPAEVRLHMTEALYAEMQAAFNPDGHVDVALAGGGHSRVSPDASPELLNALNSLAEAAKIAAQS